MTTTATMTATATATATAAAAAMEMAMATATATVTAMAATARREAAAATATAIHDGESGDDDAALWDVWPGPRGSRGGARSTPDPAENHRKSTISGLIGGRSGSPRLPLRPAAQAPPGNLSQLPGTPRPGVFFAEATAAAATSRTTTKTIKRAYDNVGDLWAL
jgi:hypothetical protein